MLSRFLRPIIQTKIYLIRSLVVHIDKSENITCNRYSDNKTFHYFICLESEFLKASVRSQNVYYLEMSNEHISTFLHLPMLQVTKFRNWKVGNVTINYYPQLSKHANKVLDTKEDENEIE